MWWLKVCPAWVIRSKARLEDTPLDRYRIRVARTSDELDQAFTLLHEAYASRGLEPLCAPRMRITEQHVLEEATVLVAYEGDEVVATLTVTLDSPAGLPLDKDYPDALAALRRDGACLVEFNSLAVEPRCRRTGVTTLLYLTAHFIARNVLDASHVVVGVNPNAAPLYRAVFGFQRFGREQAHAELSAPVVGLVQDARAAVTFFRRHYRRPMSTGRPVHEHFIDSLPSCIEIGSVPSERNPRPSKLPRQVFQDLFLRRSNRVETLRPTTRGYLRTQRSDETLLLRSA